MDGAMAEMSKNDPEKYPLQALMSAHRMLAARHERRAAEIVRKAMQQVGLEILAEMSKRIGKERVH